MECITQVFIPPLQSCQKNSDDICLIVSREWCINAKNNRLSSKGEIWEKSNDTIFCSNTGYLAKINSSNLSKLNSNDLDTINVMEATKKIYFKDFSVRLKKLFCHNAFAPMRERENYIPYIGCHQIKEVWKHYYKEYYISNYGYIVKIKPEDKNLAKQLIPDELENADENSDGYCWFDFSADLKQLFRNNAFVPINRVTSGCQICLNITGNTAEYDIHKLVARFFLQKPADFDEKKYVVHHIDNNSYNNSVTNLIYLPIDSHTGEQHRLYHPMSYKLARKPHS